MSKEKQIEEMTILARVFCQTIEDGGCCEKCAKCGAYTMAERFYNAGYRKQIKAEWKSGNKNGQYGYYCTNCDACFTGENAEWIVKSHDYCPKCGAKMKGGE